MSETVLKKPESQGISKLDLNSLRLNLTLGWGVILFVFGTLLVWSIWAPFEGAVLTSGQIAVQSNQQAIQHLEGGIVRDIYVREADKVEAGQKLIALDATSVNASVHAFEARLFDLLGAEARLLAERDDRQGLQIRPGFTDITKTSKMQTVLDMQRSLLFAREDTRSTQLHILEQRISQLQTRIEGMMGQIESKQAQIALLEDEVSRFETLAAQGNASEVRVLALKRELSKNQGEKDALRSEIAATKVQIGETRSEIVRLKQNTRESILSDLRDTQTQIEELTEQRTAALDRKHRLDIVSPRAGRVIGIRTHTVGGVITSSEPIMYIVPENDPLVAKVRISPADIDKISIGQKTALRFTAFNQDKTPRVDGVVTKVSADSLVDQGTGLSYYEGVVEFPPDILDSATLQLLPGMPVEAAIRTENRSILSYLVKPLTDSMARTFRE